jgi:hypothetical protein
MRVTTRGVADDSLSALRSGDISPLSSIVSPSVSASLSTLRRTLFSSRGCRVELRMMVRSLGEKSAVYLVTPAHMRSNSSLSAASLKTATFGFGCSGH